MALFEEALAESKKLKEIAEQNARNRIIEYVSPKIKEMIEKQLLGENIFDDDEKDIFEEALKDDQSPQDDENEEFVLSTESAKMLAGLLKEENVAENIELNMFRLHNKLQTEIAKEKKSIENLNSIKNELLSLHGRLNENKSIVDEDSYGKLDDNLDYLVDSANKIIKYQIFKSFEQHYDNLNKISSQKRLKKEAKEKRAKKVFENAKTLCVFVNENKLIKEKNDFKSLTKKLNQISSKYKEIL